MVAQFLGLKLRILANMFRRSPLWAVGAGLSVVAGISLGIVLGVVLISLRAVANIELVRDTVIVGGSIVALGFLVVPLLMGADDTVDPRGFSLFGLSSKELSVGLFLSALIGVPTLVLTLVMLASLVTWSQNFGSFLFAFLSALLVVFSCVIGARVTTSVAAFVLSSRRARDFTGLIGVISLVMLSPVIFFVVNVDWAREGVCALAGMPETLSWTPLGAMWALPGDAAVGDYGAACVKFAIALAWAGALWIGWNVLVRIMLDIPDRESRTKHYDGLGWFDTFKLGPVGAISARSITYWLRDPRYLMSLIVLPILMFLTIPLSLAGIPMQTLALLPVPAMCLFLGFTLHNDVSYDHTAVWLDLVSGTDGLADRIGRMIPVMLLGVPLVLIGSCVSVFLYGHWEVLPSMIGVSSALLLAAVGLSSYTSARFPYPAPKPGDSPFTQPQASDRASWIVQGFILVGALLVAAPSLAFAWLGLAYEPSFHAASLWVGVSAGIVVLLGGIGAGSYAYDQRSPEIMAAALRA